MKNKKLLTGLTGTIAGLSAIVPLTTMTSCSKNEKYSTIVKSTINELIELNKYPRCTSNATRSNLDKVRAYLTTQALKLGISYDDIHEDKYGNLWFDVPASSGYEDYKPLILQGHMDMVVDGLSEEDKTITPIETEVDWDNGIMHSKDYKTTLGADDGHGIAIILAILKDSSIKHGALRIILTADEDSGMYGAAYMAQYTPEVLNKYGSKCDGRDIKYLLNIDNETLGNIDYGCAGSITFNVAKEFDQVEKTSTYNQFAIQVTGFLGGHSGVDLIKNRANADKALFEVLYELSHNQSKNIQIIKHYHPNTTEQGVTTDISFGRNQIVYTATDQFYTDASEIEVNAAISKVLAAYKEKYTAEDWNTASIHMVSLNANDDVKALSTDNSKKIIELLGNNETPDFESNSFNNLWYGYHKSEGSTKSYDYSANLAPVTIKSTDNDKMYFNAVSQTRETNSTDWNNMRDLYKAVEFDGNKIDEESNYPVWDANKNNKMVELCEEAFKKSNTKYEILTGNGGVEPTWWVNANKDIQVASIGATITDAHNCKETLYIDTLQPTIDAVLYVIDSMKNA